MKVFISFFALVITVSTASQFDQQWDQFKTRYNKDYDGIENEIHRMNLFSQNLDLINQHNVEAEKGMHSYRLAVNEFADLSLWEFNRLHNGFRQTNHHSSNSTIDSNEVRIPDSIDWRKKGAVVHVKDQGQCGSCWAFSAVASLEGQYFLKTGHLVALSEQELIDCTHPEGNNGCNGGLMDNAFKGIIRLGGIESEADYSYSASDTTCVFKKEKVVITIYGYQDIKSGDESALTEAIANVGPISVAIDASSSQFQFYSSGLFDFAGCSSTQLDHGVAAVGYGTVGGKDFYIIKNSWGTGWGDKGYILMSRNKKNQCGVATAASYPIL